LIHDPLRRLSKSQEKQCDQEVSDSHDLLNYTNLQEREALFIVRYIKVRDGVHHSSEDDDDLSLS